VVSFVFRRFFVPPLSELTFDWFAALCLMASSWAAQQDYFIPFSR